MKSSMMLRIVSFIMAFGFVCAINAQDRGIYTQYYLNYELINPAYSGFEGEHDVLFNYRNRWATFPGNPKAYTVAYNGKVGEKIGLGAQLFGENIGSLNRFRAQLAYAYMFGNDEFDFSIGLSTEYSQFSLDNSALTDPGYESGDQIAENAANSLSFFSATLGFHGTYGTEAYFGLAIPDLVRARLKDPIITDDSIGIADFENEPFKNFILYLGYNHFVSNGNFYLEPSLALKQVRGLDFHVDLNLKARFLDDKLVGGLSYSVGAGSRLGFLVGTNIDNFQFLYSYDASFMDFQNYNAGAHEFTIGVRLGQNSSSEGEELMMNEPGME